MEGAALSGRLAYKFLRPGAVGPFSGHHWSVPSDAEPGEWVHGSLDEEVCRGGVHACEGRFLARWIWEELWVIELGGEVEARGHKLRAPRGRLLRRVEAWSAPVAKDFAEACAARAAEHAAMAPAEVARVAAGMAADGATRAETARATGDPYVAAHGAAVCAYISAMTALRAGGRERHDDEREWQAEWLLRELALDA
ncbi:MAG TPA: hypothetical protein VJL81_18215 [Solirubrobacterales bacterium]|nr:hypothetical protein [Solirubrobacterales bacterium]